jgi:hypothetical protein
MLGATLDGSNWTWSFDQPFFVLLHVASPRNFVGPPAATTTFPQEMVVDYVKYEP